MLRFSITTALRKVWRLLRFEEREEGGRRDGARASKLAYGEHVLVLAHNVVSLRRGYALKDLVVVGSRQTVNDSVGSTTAALDNRRRSRCSGGTLVIRRSFRRISVSRIASRISRTISSEMQMV